MARARLALAGTAAVAVAGLLVVPSAAHAAEGDLYVWLYNPTGSDVSGFGTISPTDAALSFLGTDTIDDIDDVLGVEVCGGVGFALDNDGLDDVETVSTWDTATGALLSGPVDLTVSEGEVTDVREADALADCTLLSLVQITVDNSVGWFVASIAPATGAVDPIVPVAYSDPIVELTGIATNAAGVTYLFAELATNDSAVAVADLDAGTHTPFTLIEGYSDLYGDNFTHGIDFDDNDVLWAFVGVYDDEQYHLASLAAGSDLVTGLPTDHGLVADGAGDLGGFRVNYPAPLAADGALAPPAPAPQLAATGAGLPVGVMLVAGILLLAGGALVIARRRTA